MDIHCSVIREFLKDVRQTGTVEVLEEGKKLSDLVVVAKKRGIDLKDNIDLGGLKLVYAPADKFNKNKARLPKEVYFSKLFTLVGKPLNVDHERRYVVGYYIDAQKEGNNGIAYVIVFKSNFEREWEQMKTLFKKGKLSHSYEIHSPKETRRYYRDGTFDLTEMTLAGGAILFREKPAHPESKVLEMAKKSLEKCHGLQCDLIYSSEEIITSESTPVPQVQVKQPEQREVVIKPIQYESLAVGCPSCQTNRWQILKSEGDTSLVRCGGCQKEYRVEFEDSRRTVDFLPFDQTSRMARTLLALIDLDGLSCPQCGKKRGQVVVDYKDSIVYAKCSLCELTYEKTIRKRRLLKKIEEVKKKEEGGEKMKAKEESPLLSYDKGGILVVEVEDFDKFEEVLMVEVEGDLEEGKKLTYKERKALPDSSFAVVVTVKNKVTGKPRKIRMFLIHDKDHVRNALVRLGQPGPKATLKRLGVSIDSVKKKILKRAKQLKMTTLLERYKKGEEEEAMADEPKVEEDPKPEEKPKVEEDPKPEEKPKVEEDPKQKTLKEIVEERTKEVAQKNKEIVRLNEQVKALEKALEVRKVDVAKIKADALKIADRKKELGEYADGVKDEDLLNDAMYEGLKMKMENDSLKNKVGALEKKIKEAGITEDEEDDPSGHDDDTGFSLSKVVEEKAKEI